jgi:hypothetical protein
MGILYDAAIRQKRKILIEELTKLNVTKTKDGKDILELSYEDLKYELVLASFREIDRQNESGTWF